MHRFFRDPERNTPDAPGLIICPADGLLLPIVEAVPPVELGLGEAPRPRLSVFMNVFNVHVNRNPVSGAVIAKAYRPGKFFNASFDKASEHNERMSLRLRPDGSDGTGTWRWSRSRGWWPGASSATWSRARGCGGAPDLALSGLAAGWMSIYHRAVRFVAQAGDQGPGRRDRFGKFRRTSERERRTSTVPERERAARQFGAPARCRAAGAAGRPVDQQAGAVDLDLDGACAAAPPPSVLPLLADWHTAVTSVVFAMIFDMLDGRAARMLGADTRFGAQLDSLADLVSFGVAPGVIMYTWSLSRMGTPGWIAALIFCACSAIRLARFNVQSVRDEGASKSNPYFTGLPTPGGGLHDAAADAGQLPVERRYRARALGGGRDDRHYFGADGEPAADTVDQAYAAFARTSRARRGLRRHPGPLLIVWPWATLTGGLADLCRDHSRWPRSCIIPPPSSSARPCTTRARSGKVCSGFPKIARQYKTTIQ